MFELDVLGVMPGQLVSVACAIQIDNPRSFSPWRRIPNRLRPRECGLFENFFFFASFKCFNFSFLVKFHSAPYCIQLLLILRDLSRTYTLYFNPADQFHFSCLTRDTNSRWLELCNRIEALFFIFYFSFLEEVRAGGERSPLTFLRNRRIFLTLAKRNPVIFNF